MEKSLGLATGNVYRFLDERDQNVAISIIKPFFDEYDLHCLEITWGREPVEIILEEETVSFLSSLEDVSIHFPFSPMLKDDAEAEGVIKRVNSLVNQVEASRVVIHPRKIADLETIETFQEQYNINFVLELEDWKGISYEEFISLLRDSSMDFVFDTGHAEFYGLDKIKSLIHEFEDRLCEIHVNKVKDGEAHHSFFEEGMSESLSLVKDMDVPFIIEEDFEEDNLDGLEKEIIYLDNYIMGEI